MSRLILIACTCVPLLSAGCERGSAPGPTYPQAEAYEADPNFVGEWTGEVGERAGTLVLGELGPLSFFGSFRADDGRTEYVLLLEQETVDSPGGGIVQSNQLRFTWQDGLGGRGHGWLLINRDGTALTGSFGYAKATVGLGGWTLSRVGAG